MMKPNTIKQNLYAHCRSYLEMKIAVLKKEIADLQDSANNETKSSAGDKYETGREMMQQQINMQLAQMKEYENAMQALNRVDPQIACSKVAPGALVITNQGNYYIAINAGKATINGIVYQTVSASSPIATALFGKEENATLLFNGRQFTIQNIL